MARSRTSTPERAREIGKLGGRPKGSRDRRSIALDVALRQLRGDPDLHNALRRRLLSIIDPKLSAENSSRNPSRELRPLPSKKIATAAAMVKAFVSRMSQVAGFPPPARCWLPLGYQAARTEAHSGHLRPGLHFEVLRG